MAVPLPPARAVRPILCMYYSIILGVSKFMTVFTPTMSNPRAATSVAIRNLARPLRNISREVNR